ncbi:glycosyltransferase [Ureibacillus thermosphaericus]|uniref:Glycosyltransferase involved in cell wall biosynthesis n=1 Tax=Ureibacillus thermosphaericus TaxID=51173 RepID=A0A840Q0N3_URETH|nr:glycosyltransferase [Ureibacillus thermosphaericus]MBB5150471.1 glycosyltransferase involved in cell wall biosynthesis [Ureibacillus thermosphaericus]NKZ33098.1 glycosyltransferase [Ureibacillus thermosphaericus]
MKNKNILIVTEHFYMGGLETHILSHCEVLNGLDNNLFIATSKDSDISLIQKYIKKSLFIENFSSTIGADVLAHFKVLKDFVLENDINYIQIHPHKSAIVAAAVANYLNIPFSYTAHGPLNFSPTYGEIYRNLIFDTILPSAHRIYAVSEEVQSIININNESLDVTVLPNIVPVNKNINNYNIDRKFVSMISRLDKDKINGVFECIRFFREFLKTNLGFGKKLIIIGDGDSYNDVKEFTKDDEFIEMVGYSDEVDKFIKDSYFVCGMGRVALESMAQNVPVLLVGYDGLKGFINVDNVENLARSNFSGRNAKTINYKEIISQICKMNNHNEDFCLQRWVIDNRSSKILKNEYLNLVLNSNKKMQVNKWSENFLNICKGLINDDILVSYNIVYFLDLFNINKNDKLLFYLTNELNRVKEEKERQAIELGMVRQSLHEISIKNSEVELKYSDLIDKINELSNDISNRELKLIEKVDELLNLPNKKQEIDTLYENLNQYKAEIDQLHVNLNQLNQQIATNDITFNKLSQKIYDLHGSKYFKLVNLLKRIYIHLYKGNVSEKKEFINWFYNKLLRKPYVSKNKIAHPLDELITIIEHRNSLSSNELYERHPEPEVENFESIYNKKYLYYENYLKQPNDDYTIKIKDILKSKKFKGIVVYPPAVHWEPIQRPQQFLREFAKKGYLCFFCDSNINGDSFIKEYENNLFIINNEAALLSVLKNKFCIVLCTWQGQKAFIDHLPHKLLWYDLLDKLEFFSDTDNKAIEAHNEMVQNADIVTYSAEKLYKYVEIRKDAVLLPNATNFEDFKDLNNNTLIRNELLDKKYSNVIGYFGAIEEWFDAEIINKLAERNKDWLFVIIGSVSPDIHFNNIDNIRLLGRVDYSKLVDYASLFDVALIPFKVNELTDCVSPVKYFEYRALGLPVVSTPIHEMKRYKDDYGVYLAADYLEFENSIKEALALDKQELKNNSKRFALNNQWKNRVDLVEERINNSITNLRVFANYNMTNHVAVMTGTFLGLDGDSFYSGGAERYLIDLNEIVNSIGFELIIYQYGTFPWTRKFKNIEVRSLARGEKEITELSIENVKNYNRVFYDEENGIALLNIYSAFFEAWPNVARPSIGISHGVAWDSPINENLSALTFWEQNRKIIESASLVDKMVSVDTNTANWFQTIDFKLGNKMEYIPNYVDTDEFKPVKKDSDRIVIMYPRRLYGARGLYLVLDIIDDILKKYKNVDFYFVGKGFEEDTRHVEKKIKNWKERIKWYSLDPSEMHKAYEVADIVLIPTLHSEGTSLSCLEAMSSGNAIIATRIGGLTDLVINNFNGLLIEPNSNALKNSIEYLLENPDKLKSIKENAIQVSKVFSKSQWDKKWSSLIQTYIDKTKIKESSIVTKTLHVYVDDNLDLNRFVNIIKEYLVNGYNVMVFMKKIINNRKMFSFGRLQFLTFEEDIFDPGDYIIASTKLQKIMQDKKYKVDKFI